MPIDAPPAPLAVADFEFVRTLVRSDSAIVLNPDQAYLVEIRLGRLARQEGLPSIGRLVAGVRAGGAAGARLAARVVDAMTTNETSFFRDHHPYEALRKHVLPDLVRRRAAARKLTIWSAACSTGQEPYSLAMLVLHHFPALAGWQVQVQATDLSADVLARAREGRFTQLEVNRGLPAAMLVKYFSKDGTEWRVRDEVRGLIRFDPVNLATPRGPFPRADLVLLRNVLIYFDAGVKKQILGRVRAALPADGYLLLGGAESTFGLDDGYDRVELEKVGFFRPRGAPPVSAP